MNSAESHDLPSSTADTGDIVSGPAPREDASEWERVGDGDQAAFQRVFQRHVGDVYAFVARRCGDPTLAEDLTSEVFLQAWRQRTDVRPHDGSLRPWLYGVAANLVRQHWRSRNRFGRAIARLPIAESDQGHDDLVANGLDNRRRLDQLRRAVNQLPASQVEVWSMRVWEEMDYDAIALALDIPVGTVRSRLSRARARLRQLVPDDHAEPGPCNLSTSPSPPKEATVSKERR